MLTEHLSLLYVCSYFSQLLHKLCNAIACVCTALFAFAQALWSARAWPARAVQICTGLARQAVQRKRDDPQQLAVADETVEELVATMPRTAMNRRSGPVRVRMDATARTQVRRGVCLCC